MHPQITDQPRVRPNVVSANRAKHVILSLAVPPLSHAAGSTRLVSAVFGLIDALEKVNLRPETKSKIKRTRENFAKTLKDEVGREAREEAADAKVTAKRRAEEERIANLSATEQQKVILLLCLSFASRSFRLQLPSISSWSGIASAICARHREGWSKNKNPRQGDIVIWYGTTYLGRTTCLSVIVRPLLVVNEPD